jgi:ATP-dependent 26S proteasome regulatory subunit
MSSVLIISGILVIFAILFNSNELGNKEYFSWINGISWISDIISKKVLNLTTGNQVIDTLLFSNIISKLSMPDFSNIKYYISNWKYVYITTFYKYKIELIKISTKMDLWEFVNSSNEYKSLLHSLRNKQNNVKHILIEAKTALRSDIINDKKNYLSFPPNTIIKLTDNIYCITYQNIEKYGEKTIIVEKKYKIILYSSKSIDHLKKFLEKCKEEYDEYLDDVEHKCKYYIDMKKYDEKEDKMTYKMSEFITNRTFDNIFLPNKQNLVDSVNFFINNKEYYNKNGFPYTLGILLEGLPGCGKTSTIKAIANETKRHIINIKLSNIKNKNALFELIYSETKEGLKINSKKCIFVIEDIDCDCDIVLKRTDDLSDNDSKSNKSDKSDKSDKSYNKLECDFANNNNDVKISKIEKFVNNTIDYKLENYTNIDENLTLSDLLNIIDGIIETPGRILIMTTNHVKKLDPALIRPGRIDITINYTYCSKQIYKEMFKFYYDIEIDEDKLTELDKYNITPSRFTQLCKKYMNDYMKVYKELVDEC